MFDYQTGEPIALDAAVVAAQIGVPDWARDGVRFLPAYNRIPGLSIANGTLLTGAVTVPGTYTMQLDFLEDGASYGTWTEPLTVTEAGTEPDPTNPPPPARHALSERLTAYLGMKDDEHALELADAHLPVVEAFVYGYTRGRGFHPHNGGPYEAADYLFPAPDLAHVIVSAAARLTANPEQLSSYQTGDYSERPAVLNGWTLPELAVLHRYRRRSA